MLSRKISKIKMFVITLFLEGVNKLAQHTMSSQELLEHVLNRKHAHNTTLILGIMFCSHRLIQKEIVQKSRH